ncbi:Palmitoyltransferase PFA3 [Podospora appendiculata]|uniref:Palmitoyltransferase n=1 Tax=Podospora appendiculata TaxID=314037 RepID=A0AAE1CAE7_9PEZI|nr:Palmitoyltransferase PFA3 [Podospora appendiculata]
MAARRWARKLERYCCACATYFPLAFVYGITSWAIFVIVTLCSVPSKVSWLGRSAAFFGITLYILLNWCYTTAVFTPPGSTTNDNGYSTLPTHAPPTASSFTVKSNGEFRFCKKCQARKPDRAHHCSTCRRCVLKMDHHCPWLATCIGLRNHKAFLLFLSNTTYVETMMPVNYIMLCVISGIIGLVVGAFTGWHIYLASRGQTTIECLEKTRYLSPLRRTMQQAYVAQHTAGQGVALPKYGQQLLDLHQNALPGITRPEEGEEMRRSSHTSQYHDIAPISSDPELLGGSRRFTYDELERYRAQKRHEEYLDEQDSTKLPNAFDLGPRRNLLHLFGPSPWLWALPVCNTTGDGWSWQPNPKWIETRDRIAREREQQRERERVAGWGGNDDEDDDNMPLQQLKAQIQQNQAQPKVAGAGRHYLQAGPQTQQYSGTPSPVASAGRITPSKADRILGRDPNMFADAPFSPPAGSKGYDVSMKRLSPAGREVSHGYDGGEYEDEDGYFEGHAGGNSATLKQQEKADAAERHALNVVTNGRWGRGGGGGPSGLLGGRTGSRGVSVGAGGSREFDDDEGVD